MNVHVVHTVGLGDPGDLLFGVFLVDVQGLDQKLQATHEGFFLVLEVGLLEVVLELGREKEEVLVELAGEAHLLFGPLKAGLHDLDFLLPRFFSFSHPSILANFFN